MIEAREFLPSLAAATGAVAGSLASYFSMRPRVRRLERRLTAVLRLLLTTSPLTPQQAAIAEELLADDLTTM